MRRFKEENNIIIDFGNTVFYFVNNKMILKKVNLSGGNFNKENLQD
jgi:hypothetical protein